MMKKVYGILGTVACAFLVVGGILLAIGVGVGASHNFSLFKFFDVSIGRPELASQEYMKLDEFDSLYIDMNYGGVEIVKGSDYAVEYQLYSDNVVCEVNNGRLVFKESGKKHVGINLGIFGNYNYDSYVKVYVPEKDFDDVEIHTDMGEMKVKDLSCGKLTLESNMGAVNCINVKADRVDLDVDMGSVYYKGTISGRIKADLDMGGMILEGYLDCDMDIDADMGSVDITTYYSSGSYRCDLETDMGQKNIHDNGGGIDSDKVHDMKIDCDMGSIEITYGSNP